MDPVIDEQASRAGIDDLAPNPSPQDRPWQEPVPLAPAEDNMEPQQGEATGIAGGGMPEAASQADNPGTDTDLSLRPVKKRINLDQV
jgi:hypothetical protein